MGKKVKDHNHIDVLAEEVMEKIKCENIILTLGEHGMMILEKSNGKITKKLSEQRRGRLQMFQEPVTQSSQLLQFVLQEDPA